MIFSIIAICILLHQLYEEKHKLVKIKTTPIDQLKERYNQGLRDGFEIGQQNVFFTKPTEKQRDSLLMIKK